MKTMLIISRHDCILLYNYCLLIMRCDQSLDLSYRFACFMCLVKSGVNILSVNFFPAEGKNCLYLLAVHACSSTEK